MDSENEGEVESPCTQIRNDDDLTDNDDNSIDEDEPVTG
jgi:hypothetical protein